MATSIPIPLNASVPVTPPPDPQTFLKGPSFSPQLLKTFAQAVCSNMDMKLPEQAQTQSQPQPQITNPGVMGEGMPPLGSAALPLDPRYVTMLSRVANYYQQRSQAVANYQQQRCQAWANLHRKKCQEMMRAAMLVVAWYIRDRIQRRRRRQRRQFRRGLSQACVRSKITKGESVRRWVMAVPESVLSHNNQTNEKFADQEEAGFSMDKEQPVDKDSKLFNVADNLIKSQLSKIDVPLMGALSFDESESESEEEPVDVAEEEEEEEGEEDDEDLMDDDEDYEDDSIENYGNIRSEQVEVTHGTSGERNRSSVS